MDQTLLIRYLDKLDEMVPLIVRQMHHELDQVLKDGITANQFLVMKIISDHGQMTVSEVADTFNVSLSAVTSLVDRLHKAGMIKRHRSEADRRVVWLELTGEGHQMVNTCQEGRRRVLQHYLGKLDEKELVFMINIHEKIITMMRQEDKGQVNNEE